MLFTRGSGRRLRKDKVGRVEGVRTRLGKTFPLSSGWRGPEQRAQLLHTLQRLPEHLCVPPAKLACPHSPWITSSHSLVLHRHSSGKSPALQVWVGPVLGEWLSQGLPVPVGPPLKPPTPAGRGSASLPPARPGPEASVRTQGPCATLPHHRNQPGSALNTG